MSGLSEQCTQTVCKRGQGNETCAFLAYSGADQEWICAKGTELEPILATRKMTGEMIAQGDNCSGPPFFTLKEKTGGVPTIT